MKSGDIIYFIFLLFFMILGFFNKSRKKKQQQMQSEAESPPFFDERREELPPQPKGRVLTSTPPSVSVTHSGTNARKQFRSSLDLVSIHDEQSSRPGYAFDYDANSFYEKDPDSIGTPDNAREETVRESAHPLIRDMVYNSGYEELKKGLIYGEIIQRKY